MDKCTEDVQKQVEALQEWAKNHSNFPKDIENKLLLRFLHSCYYDIDKAKNAAELFFSIRSTSPELFSDRDPLSPQIKKSLDIINLAQYEISDGRNVWIWQLNDPGLEKYDYFGDAKLFMLATDSWLLADHRLEDSDIVIMDVKDITLKFITKFNLSIARKLSKYQEDAMPIRLKQIHIVNAPPFIDKVFSLMKPLLKQEVTQMIHFHTPNSETIYEYVSKDDLPEDYGGKREKMEEHMKRVLDLLHTQRQHFLHNNLWRVDKKPKNKTEISTEIGNFRTLAID